MIGKGKKHITWCGGIGVRPRQRDKRQAVATEIARHELYGCTGAEMVQEMKPYHIDFPERKKQLPTVSRSAPR